MKEQQKFGFFKKMFLAITDFRIYPFTLKTEKLSKSFMYFIKFLILITAVISIYYTINVFSVIDNFIDNYEVTIPEFTLNEGVLNVNDVYTKEIQNDIIGVTDTSYTYEEFLNSESYKKNTRYDTRIFINSDSITFENYDGTGIQLLFKDIEKNFNKVSFYEYIVGLYSNYINRAIIFVVIFISVFIGYALMKFLEILLIAFIVSTLGLFMGIRVDSKNYFKIAIYAMTLPYLVEVISILLTGTIKEYAAIATILLAYVYVFYAIRAVKLDAILIIANGKKKKKIENEREDLKSNSDLEESKEDEKKLEEKKEEVESDKENNESNNDN